MEKDVDKLVAGMKKLTIAKPVYNPPPPLKPCKSCHYNIGSDDKGLCASCDPNHIWWTQHKKVRFENGNSS